MAAWSDDELSKIDAADELQIQSRRRDGTLRNPVTIWVVRVGDDLYVRSVNGPSGSWFRGAQVRHEGHVHAGGVDKDVDFVDAGHDIDDALDTAYRSKYRRYPTNIVDSILSPQACDATIKLVPHSPTS